MPQNTQNRIYIYIYIYIQIYIFVNIFAITDLRPSYSNELLLI